MYEILFSNFPKLPDTPSWRYALQSMSKQLFHSHFSHTSRDLCSDISTPCENTPYLTKPSNWTNPLNSPVT